MDEKDLLNMFMWAHLVKDSSNDFNILYDGNIGNIGICIDSTQAESWYVNTYKSVEYKDLTIKFLWDVINVRIPLFKKPRGYESVKMEYLALLNSYIKQGIIGDRRGTVISRLMENLDVVIWDKKICFVEVKRFDEKDIIFKSKTTELEFGADTFKINIENNW